MNCFAWLPESRKKDYDQQLTVDERDFQKQTKERTAALSVQPSVTDHTYGGADYMTAYRDSSRTTSFASTLDKVSNDGALKKIFALAASGRNTASADKPAQPGPANEAVTKLNARIQS